MAEVRVVVWRSERVGQVQELELVLAAPATVADAVRAAGWQVTAGCGVWGHPCNLDTVLMTSDRVELYRPLTVDPKVARRERFARQGVRGAGLFATRRSHSKAGY